MKILLLILPVVLTLPVGIRGETTRETSAVVAGEAALPDSAVIAAIDPVFHPPKSVKTAYAWAVGGTVLGLGPGLLVGPSLGQLYAGSEWSASLGMFLRTAGAGMLLYAALGSINADPEGQARSDRIGYSGIGLYLAGAAYSFWDTYHAVQRANDRAHKAHESRMSLAPVLYPALFPTLDGRFAAGLAAHVAF